MKKIFLGTIFTIMTSISVFGNTWELVKERDWIAKKDFPTNQFVFYESVNGLKKAIYQINGSGRCAVLSVIYDIEIIGDSIYLRNGLNLEDYQDEPQKRQKDFPIQEVLCFKNETIPFLESKDFIYTRIFDKPHICDWFGNYTGSPSVPLEKLKEIPIQENMIYPRNSFKYLPDPENCGNDNNPLLTETEAVFLDEYLEAQIKSKEFDFTDKRILFVTGSSGATLGSKSAYFDKVKEWKEMHNNRITTSLIVLDEKDREKYGYDAILTYWVKVIIAPKGIAKILKRAKGNDK